MHSILRVAGRYAPPVSPALLHAARYSLCAPGVSASTFTDAMRQDLINAVAKAANLLPSQVRIVSVTDAARRQRSLSAAGGVKVDTAIAGARCNALRPLRSAATRKRRQALPAAGTARAGLPSSAAASTASKALYSDGAASPALVSAIQSTTTLASAGVVISTPPSEPVAQPVESSPNESGGTTSSSNLAIIIGESCLSQ